ncbi:MAG TPA: kelch repeat-containing protein [Pyrinomonadaceae bacterium]|jgi:hypothetical protein
MTRTRTCKLTRAARKLALLLALFCLVALAGCQYFAQDARHGRVYAAGRMTTRRAAHTATLLADGRVLLAGGMERAAGEEINTATAELFDPASGACRAAGRMQARRAGHTATLLTDGDVLLAGGFDEGVPLASAELYHPATDTFTPLAPMRARRSGHTATRLADGRVLLAGGHYNLSDVNADAELYDPATRSFGPAGVMTTPRVMHSATLLADGRVLLAGGSARFRSDVLPSAELYEPGANTYTPTAPMSRPRTKHAAALLADGRVLILGGTDDASALAGAQASAEVYDPARHAFAAAGAMGDARFKINSCAATLPNGLVLVGGGSRYVELYDPRARVFGTAAGRLDGAWLYPTVTPLAGGRVLLTGGYDDGMNVTAGLWLYQSG